MKKLIAVFGLLFSMQSFANIIDINLSDTNVDPGETITVTLRGDNFDAFDSFSFSFLFDASLFDFVLDSGASNLPDDRADSFLILSGGPGFVGINFFDFFNLFSDDFFVSFGLIALAEGTGVFSIDKSNDNAPLFADSINGVELVVDDSLPVSASVSAPASLGLFAMAALALIGFRRKA